MLLIVGLGNPGEGYARQRHNVGFSTVEALAAGHGFGPWREKFQSLISEGRIASPKGDVRALLIKPQTFYNNSGEAVRAAAQFHKSSTGQIVVFHDELDLAPARFRMKKGGGHGGNNGIRSISAHVSPDVRRGRIGIGHPGDKDRVQGHVLSDFGKAERAGIDMLIEAIVRSAGFMAAGDDERFQTEVLRLAPAPKMDPKQAARNGATPPEEETPDGL
jgi:peptidyl-tRNA hydrolase, PTH1 family